MASTGPGVDAPGNFFIGSSAADSVVIGKNRALVVNNATTPPEITVAGAYLGNNSALFGSGVDGNRTVSTNISLTEDVYAENYTVTSTGIVNTVGFRIFVKGTLTLDGLIRNNGNNGGNGTTDAGGAGAVGNLGTVTTPGYTSGGAGGAPATAGATASAQVICIGGAGGAGGSGNDNGTLKTGGDGGQFNVPTAQDGGEKMFNDVMLAVRGRNINGFLVSPGTGGGGGGGGSGGGGGGGSAGGLVVVCASTILQGQNGKITAIGGAGGNGFAGTYGSGGGGGGGGGVIVVVYKGGTYTDVAGDVAGGAGGSFGAGGGTRTNGTQGVQGKRYVFKV